MNISLESVNSNSRMVNMGNVLESDYSASEAECDTSNNDIKPRKNEVRSQGDGRESDGDIAAGEDLAKLHRKDLSQAMLSRLPPQFAQPVVPFQGPGCSQTQQAKKLESPKQLPPKGQLIPLKPVRIQEINSQPHHDLSTPINKQRDPKFVPYEPYRGAVRSMTGDDSLKKHSRIPSNASSVSGSSTGYVQNQSMQSMNAQQTTTPGNDTTLLNHINHYKNQTHSLTLMKERIKIAEKDIIELQTENTRLKKLMVDSMTGSANYDGTMNGSTSEGGRGGESVDNLNDEIEVWRSKFLSSCILVDQLTKENRDMKIQISSAAHIFREIKSTAGLTPGLYDQINYWLNRNALGINQLDYNYNSSSSVDDYNYDLTPHQSSPRTTSPHF